MNLNARKVAMDCTLVLSERETEMLGYLAGYGAQAIAELICKKFTTKFEQDEWKQFWSAMRHELENTHKLFDDTRRVFSGTKRAAELERKP